MCGIAGYVGSHQGDLGLRMARLLAHRGPDDEGEAILTARDGRTVSLAHRRLSIIDLPGGHQPLSNERGTVQVVFNGEIYNFAALRVELEAAGHVFRTNSDTEVIVHLYEEDGPDLVHRLRGMFAFALWDAERDRLVLARDRLGVKPLYYAQPANGGIGLAWASELKALFPVPGVDRQIDDEAVAAYLTYLYVPHPKTIVRGAHKLPPGHLLVYEEGRARVERYWTLDPEASGADDDPDRLWELIDESVDLRLVADVPVGALLSGGVDSSSIVASASARRRAFPTFTIVFGRNDERRYDESADARLVAEAFGASHHELEATADLAGLLPTIVRHFDEPFGNPAALVAYAIAELTRKHVKVALDGAGSDELFAGYERFRGLSMLRWYASAPRPLRALAAAAAHALPESTTGRHALRRARSFALGPIEPDAAYVAWIRYFDPDARSALLTHDTSERLRESRPPEAFIHDLFARAPVDDAVNRVSFVELQSYLPCNVLEYGDRMSMAHGLELRQPYCDHKLVEHAFALPGSAKLNGRQTKAILRRALEPRLPARPLQKPKRGFNAPIGVWLNGELRELVDEYLAPEVVASRGLFRPEAVTQLVETLRTRRRDVSSHVWGLVVLEQWFREYGPAAA
jgi:asparagine synthase (glutamine-hydrolysing)